MTTTATMDESLNKVIANPGAHLAALRQQRGYSQEYVASKLHLRINLIELLELDDYERLPQPVFVQGYFRAYAKLLGVDANPLVESYNSQFVPEKKCEKALWQTKRESYKGEKIIRWVTLLFGLSVIVAVGIWWQKNKDTQEVFASKDSPEQINIKQPASDIRLTDLSKMQSILSTNPQLSLMEKQVE